MPKRDRRPPVGIAHVVLETDRIDESARFMTTIGMRSVWQGADVCVFELRGGTHLLLMASDRVVGGDAGFDLMVDDLAATRARLAQAGLRPTRIKQRKRIGHEIFTVREPAGHVITFYSSHASGEPV